MFLKNNVISDDDPDLDMDGYITDDDNNRKRRKTTKKIYSQKYCKEWEKVPAFRMWLQPVAHEPRQAFCKWCHMKLQAKKLTLTRHTTKKSHEEQRKKFDLTSQCQLTIQASMATAEQRKHLHAISNAEGKISLFIADHCSVVTVDHLTELVKNVFPDSKSSAFHLKRTKCAAVIVNILGPHFMAELLQDIGCLKYSIIIDESTDIAVLKMLGITIWYVSRKKKKIVSTYLGLVELENGTAPVIVDAIDSYLEEMKLDSGQCLGTGTDNASVMVGKEAGVHVLLEKKWNRKLINIPCPCHGIQLSVSSACTKLPSALEFFIRETYNCLHTPPFDNINIKSCILL